MCSITKAYTQDNEKPEFKARVLGEVLPVVGYAIKHHSLIILCIMKLTSTKAKSNLGWINNLQVPGLVSVTDATIFQTFCVSGNLRQSSKLLTIVHIVLKKMLISPQTS